MKLILLLLLSAAAAYLLGSFNGAILLSRWVYHSDVREQGSGNAGLTNYARVFGWKTAPLMILIDVGKTVAAGLLASWAFSGFLGAETALLGRYWAALWVCVGHDFPFLFSFRGGKGILCAGTALFLFDWRIAAVGFGIFFLTLLLTRYVSLGSILACISLPVMTAVLLRTDPMFPWIEALALAIAALAIWGHRANIQRLCTGQERKFHFHRNKEQKP